MQVRVWWTYTAFDPATADGWTVAVVDCLRATTTVAAALASGAQAVRPAELEVDARRWAAERGALLAGERECVPPPGFDLGNSPAAFTPDVVRGREVVLWTTNGSRALARATAAGLPTLALSLVNAGAVAAHLGRQGCRRLAIVCAGTDGSFSLEDAFAAGALLHRLSAAGPRMDERALAAMLLYRGGRDDPRGVLDGTVAAAKLRHRGLGADVRYAAGEDAVPVVPLWRSGALRLPRG